MAVWERRHIDFLVQNGFPNEIVQNFLDSQPRQSWFLNFNEKQKNIHSETIGGNQISPYEEQICLSLWGSVRHRCQAVHLILNKEEVFSALLFNQRIIAFTSGSNE